MTPGMKLSVGFVMRFGLKRTKPMDGEIYLIERKDWLYSVLKRDGAAFQRIGLCDKLSAEEVALRYEKMGTKVAWVYQGERSSFSELRGVTDG